MQKKRFSSLSETPTLAEVMPDRQGTTGLSKKCLFDDENDQRRTPSGLGSGAPTRAHAPGWTYRQGHE